LNGVNLDSAKLNGAFLEDARLFCCRNQNNAGIDSVYFADSINTIPIADWDSLKAKSTGIPKGRRRDLYLERIATAQAHCDSLMNSDSLRELHYAELARIQSDSAGFVEYRKRLACKNTWAAEGLLAQAKNFEAFDIETMLLEHICDSCRDSLELIRTRLENRPMGSRRGVLNSINNILMEKAKSLKSTRFPDD